jgi:DNA topoisomerase-1
MAKNLVIVESPAKAKTISGYLGKDFVVKSSFGHIRDLPSKGISVDIEKNFEPTYEISDDKKKVVKELKTAAKGKEVWLASDEDREGEAIAWHLAYALGLDPKKTKRIVFHEITKPAIEAAVQKPRNVDIKLVEAQQARRILDRLVGYELSPVLWKKVKTGLSAGRVQSVAVRLIVEREREIENFAKETFYKTIGTFASNKDTFDAELSVRFDEQKKVKKYLEDIAQATFTISSISKKPASRNPSPPFTTSTLQQIASQRLGFSVRQTMRLAQELYEGGHITYMRTDSTNLSQTAVSAITNYVQKEYGDDYLQNRSFATKSKGAQEAHEAIRPTNIGVTAAGKTDQSKKLYRLIWQRAVASQMAPAKLEKTEITITSTTRKETFVAQGEILQFDGFIKVYSVGQKDKLLPDLNEGQSVDSKQVVSSEQFKKPPARYSEASLVKKLEELGIGRPSTYAPTISTIQDRGYIEKRDTEGEPRDVSILTLIKGNITESSEVITYGTDRNKLMPTFLADQVTDFLVKNFSSILDYDFTAQVEEEFDEIAEGRIKWQEMLGKFYKDFHPLIGKAEEVPRDVASQSRKLGNDPKTGKPVIARYGRFGPMLQIGEVEEEEKPQFAPMPAGRDIKEVTLEEALEMFKLPRKVGTTDKGEEITANIGRFGPYIQIGKTYVSIKDPFDPFTIKESDARKLYKEKLAKDKKRNIAVFGTIKVLLGPFGPYVTDGKKNAKIPKDTDPKKLTENDAQKLLDEAPDKKRRFPRKKASK